ncbi:MAG: hydroxypyruvate isomerase family protein [Nitritalea sp.]
MKRRTWLKNIGISSLALGTASLHGLAGAGQHRAPTAKDSRIRHAFCSWLFPELNLTEQCGVAQRLGFQAIDLVEPAGWPTLQAHGLACSMCNGAEISLTKGFAQAELHEELFSRYAALIPQVAKAGFTNLICFSGNQGDLSDAACLENCAAGLKPLLPLAEEYGVVLHMELLNSRVDHPDYWASTSAKGIALCETLNSEHFKLLFDIYHMQVMEGDLIRSIQMHHKHFGHYHTAGNPGRGELSNKQEIQYPAVMAAIMETGYTGYIAHEFMPKNPDKQQALAEAMAICDSYTKL